MQNFILKNIVVNTGLKIIVYDFITFNHVLENNNPVKAKNLK